jgi:metallo-beta-lactamase class B
MRRPARRKRWLIVFGCAITAIAILGYLWTSAIRRNRSIPDEPFQIAGNLYYVGSTRVTSFLITGPQGHVLIDGGYAETAPLIIGSIAKLGFNIKDVKVLLNSHGSFFELSRKRRERATAKDPGDPFIDRTGYLAWIDASEKQFRATLADQQKSR